MAGKNLSIELHADQRMLAALSRHRCVGCGDCCRGPGHVFLYRDDIKRLASELHLEEKDFLILRCVIVKWTREDSEQFRIALTKNASEDECVFLEGTRCGIHRFKPLQCKAGPADWQWISNPKFFWLYERRSPSFRNPEDTSCLVEADILFRATLSAEKVAAQATSLESLATFCDVSEDVVRSLKVIKLN